MTRREVAKVVFLVILVFILCLPEFFTVFRVLSVSLRCEMGLCGDEFDAAEETRVNSTCPEQWKNLLRAADQRNVTQTDASCSVCQANVDMPELDHNGSSPAETMYFEVSLTLQQNYTASVHLTLFGHVHNNSQYLRLSDRESHNYAAMHCPPSVHGANHSCCLLLLSNRTFAKDWLPWKRSTEGDWSCVLRVTWLSLLCVALLLIVITVTQQILHDRKRSSDKLKMRMLDYTSKAQHSPSAIEETEADMFFTYNSRNGINCLLKHTKY